MNDLWQINQTLDIPIYQQLVDKIRAAVKAGTLETGAQLPTVQELSDRLGVARGTIKRAYDELEYEGIIEKIRGRGTFICQQRLDAGSRKDRAMAAIDDLLDSLEEIGFSAGEVNIFLDLKLRQRMEQVSLLKVAVLDCNPESLSQMAEQLRDVGNIEVYSYLVDNAMEYPYSMAEEMDLIVTTTAHAALLSQVLPEKEKLVRIALRPNPRCLSRIIRMRHDIAVGIVSHSERFGKILQETCQTYNHSVSLSEPVLFSQITDWDAWLSDKDAVLLPKAYERYAGNGIENLRQFGERKKLIPCDYEMDEGSFLYLEERIRRAQEKKTI